ncbi:MAG: hypothetical protein ABIH18_08280 [Candidatus Omnitrophota bacterium]
MTLIWTVMLRNILKYFGVDLDLAWKVIKQDMRYLKKHIVKIKETINKKK